VLLYAFTLLAIYPQIQTKLRSEIQAVCGDQSPAFRDIPHLIYALCVMYETMRLHPVTASLPLMSVANQDETLLGSYLVPKNTVLGMDLYNLHRNERYWVNPNKFDPSRFDGRETAGLDGKIKVSCRGAFFGFSDGPRGCLGITRSCNANGKTTIRGNGVVTCFAMVTQRWTIRLSEGWTEQEAHLAVENSAHVLTLQPVVNIPLVFKRR
jgi:hypothetical protein